MCPVTSLLKSTHWPCCAFARDLALRTPSFRRVRIPLSTRQHARSFNQPLFLDISSVTGDMARIFEVSSGLGHAMPELDSLEWYSDPVRYLRRRKFYSLTRE